MPKLVAITSKSRQISADAVRIELSRILQSAGFIHSSRMRRFLQFVIEETLGGRASQLCEYSIGISVFDRDESFEPGLDPIVRNDARRLRNKLLEYYQRRRASQENGCVIEVPKGGYVPVFRLASAPVTERPSTQYRLRVSLIRVADGSEILSRAYDLEHENGSLHFELISRKNPIACTLRGQAGVLV